MKNETKEKEDKFKLKKMKMMNGHVVDFQKYRDYFGQFLAKHNASWLDKQDSSEKATGLTRLLALIERNQITPREVKEAGKRLYIVNATGVIIDRIKKEDQDLVEDESQEGVTEYKLNGKKKDIVDFLNKHDNEAEEKYKNELCELLYQWVYKLADARGKQTMNNNPVYLNWDGDAEGTKDNSLRVSISMELMKAGEGMIEFCTENVNKHDVYGMIDALSKDGENMSMGHTIRDIKDTYLSITFGRNEEFMSFYTRWIASVKKCKEYDIWASFAATEVVARLMSSVKKAPEKIRADIAAMHHNDEKLNGEELVEKVRQKCLADIDYDPNRGASAARQATEENSSVYKKAPCRFYNKARGCNRGDSCTFIHDEENKNNNRGVSGKKERTFRGTCFKCKKQGHREADCPQKGTKATKAKTMMDVRAFLSFLKEGAKETNSDSDEHERSEVIRIIDGDESDEEHSDVHGTERALQIQGMMGENKLDFDSVCELLGEMEFDDFTELAIECVKHIEVAKQARKVKKGGSMKIGITADTGCSRGIASNTKLISMATNVATVNKTVIGFQKNETTNMQAKHEGDLMLALKGIDQNGKEATLYQKQRYLFVDQEKDFDEDDCLLLSIKSLLKDIPDGKEVHFGRDYFRIDGRNKGTYIKVPTKGKLYSVEGRVVSTDNEIAKKAKKGNGWVNDKRNGQKKKKRSGRANDSQKKQAQNKQRAEEIMKKAMVDFNSDESSDASNDSDDSSPNQ